MKLCQELWQRQEEIRQELHLEGLHPFRSRGGIPGREQFEACGLWEAARRYSRDDLLHVLEWHAGEARKKKTLEWFDGRRNWRTQAIESALGQGVPKAKAGRGPIPPQTNEALIASIDEIQFD